MDRISELFEYPLSDHVSTYKQVGYPAFSISGLSLGH